MSISSTTRAFEIQRVEVPLGAPPAGVENGHHYWSQKWAPFGVDLVGRKVFLVVKPRHRTTGCGLDVNVFDMVNREWQCLETIGEKPSAEQGCVNLVDDQLYCLLDNNAGLWKYDIPLNLWQSLTLKSHGDVLISTLGHSLDFLAHRKWMVMFGGWCDDSLSSNVSVLDVRLQAWIKPKISGNPPAPRSNHSFCVVNDTIYIYGGLGVRTRIFADLYTLRSCHGILTWSRLRTTGYRRRPSQQSTLTNICGKLLVLGGMDDSFRGTSTPCIYEPRACLWHSIARAPPAKYTISATRHQLKIVGHLAVVTSYQTVFLFVSDRYPYFYELRAVEDEGQ